MKSLLVTGSDNTKTLPNMLGIVGFSKFCVHVMGLEMIYYETDMKDGSPIINPMYNVTDQ